MATTTPNFGWPVPTSTDLVKNGATAIEALGDAIDASLVDLEGGTTGQVLSKASNADMDFAWVTSDDANALQNTQLTAKGALISAFSSATPATLTVGTNGQVLTADSTAATGLAWATASAGSTNVAGKNGVLNSNFSIWQRGTSGAMGGSGSTYLADRWAMYSGSAGTVSRQTTSDTTNLPNIQYCARVQKNSGEATNGVQQIGTSFETINSIPFAGKTVTFSFYARKGANFSSASDLLSGLVKTGTGTDQNVVSTGYTGSVTAVTSSATLTATWQRFTATGTIGSTATEIGIEFRYTSTGTAGAADYFEVTGVQLEIAGSASAYSPNTSTYQAELAACQRYFERVSASSNAALLSGGYVQNSTVAWFTSPLVAKRTAPSLAFSGAGTPQIIYSGGSGVNCTMGTVNGFADRNSVSFYATAASAVLTSPNSAYLYANGGQVNVDANSEL